MVTVGCVPVPSISGLGVPGHGPAGNSEALPYSSHVSGVRLYHNPEVTLRDPNKNKGHTSASKHLDDYIHTLLLFCSLLC